jgi:hypothetical protein
LEIDDCAIAVLIMLAVIALTAITTYLNNSGFSYRKAITGDPFSREGWRLKL